MKASLIPITQLLNNTHQFIIPEYQRKYSWTEKNCKKLWSNIISLCNKDKKPLSWFYNKIRL